MYEWVKKFHPTALQWRRPRIGPIPRPEEAKWYKMVRRYPDIVFYEKGIVYIVEAKVRADPAAIAQLELYIKLFPDTPEFVEFKDKPIKLIFLTSCDDLYLRKLCKEKNIEYVFYQPEWIKLYLREKLYA